MVLTGIIVSTFVVVIAGVDIVAVAFAVDIVTLVKVVLTTTVIVGGIDTEILSLLLLVVFFLASVVLLMRVVVIDIIVDIFIIAWCLYRQ